MLLTRKDIINYSKVKVTIISDGFTRETIISHDRRKEFRILIGKGKEARNFWVDYPTKKEQLGFTIENNKLYYKSATFIIEFLE